MPFGTTTGVLVFDTGFGFGNAELDATYHPVGRPILDVLRGGGHRARTRSRPSRTATSTPTTPARTPPSPASRSTSSRPSGSSPTRRDHTVLEWIDRPDITYLLVGGDHDITPAIRLVATPGHTAGHQSLVVDTADGPVVLAGQACYTAGEWIGDPDALEGRTERAGPGGLRRSLERLRALSRSACSSGTTAPSGPRVPRDGCPCYPSRAVLGGELAVPCSLQSAPAGPNPLSRSPFSVAARRCDVEDRVPRSGEPRTVSGPEGSSTKRPSPGAAERPGPSRSSVWARATDDRRRVHGTPVPLAPDRRRS